MWMLRAIAELIPEATMSVTSTQIKLSGMDAGHIGMFDIQMDLTKLASRTACEDNKEVVIGFKTKIFKDFLAIFNNNALTLEHGVSKNEDVLVMYEENSNQTSGSKRKQRNEVEMKLLDIDCEVCTPPERDDWIEIDIEATKWKRIIKEATQVSKETIKLQCSVEQFKYSSNGDYGKAIHYLFPDNKEHNIFISVGDGAPAVTNIELSLNMVNNGCGKIEVKAGDRMKLRMIGGEQARAVGFNYYLGNPEDPECTLVYYLMGRIDEDD